MKDYIIKALIGLLLLMLITAIITVISIVIDESFEHTAVTFLLAAWVYDGFKDGSK